MKRFILTLVIILGVVLTSFGQINDTSNVEMPDTNYTDIINYGDSIIVNTVNNETIEVLMNTFGMASVSVNEHNVFKSQTYVVVK